MRKAVEMMLNYHENNVIIMRKRLLILAETWPGHIFKRLLKEKHLIFHIVTLNKNISLFLRAQNKHKNMFIKTAESIMIWAWPCVCVCARISEQSLSSLCRAWRSNLTHWALLSGRPEAVCMRPLIRTLVRSGGGWSQHRLHFSIDSPAHRSSSDRHTHTHTWSSLMHIHLCIIRSFYFLQIMKNLQLRTFSRWVNISCYYKAK